MMKKYNNEKGLLSLEASISLTIFLFLMLFMYSFFVVFEARNHIGHAILAASDSLSLDAYENSALGDSDTLGEILYNVYGEHINNDNGFSDYRNWYNETNGNQGLSDIFLEVIKTRFVSYITGGDNERIDDILRKRYHIKDGIDGLDFSGYYISEQELCLSVKYTLEYEFNVFSLGEIEFQQSSCSRLWKD